MTFETDERTSGSGSASGASSLLLRRMAQYLWLRPIRGDVEASGRGVRKWMIEDVQRPLVLAEDELEVIVVRGIGDRDRHQIRRSTQKSLTVIPLLSRDASSVRQGSSVASNIS